MTCSRVLLLVSLAAAPFASGGCATTRPLDTREPRPPAEIHDLDDFEAGYNELVLLGEGDPERAVRLEALLGFLGGYIDVQLAGENVDEASTALRYAVGLYTPAELRSAPTSEPLAGRARAIYARVARHGDEQPAMLALAIEQRFGSEAQRRHALEHWRLLESWMIDNDPQASDPLRRYEQLGYTLEHVAAVFPSPFVTERLADLYVARYDVARQARIHGNTADPTLRWRMEATGYHLLRAYLRADDLDGAVQAADRVAMTVETARQRRDIAEAQSARRSALPLLSLLEQFVPDGPETGNQAFITQGWGIVDNLSRRAVAQFPKDPYAHLSRARALHTAGLLQASAEHLRRALALKEDIFEAWQALAQLEQETLARLADTDPVAALSHLEAVEAIHARAIELWSDRPIQPGLPQAFFTVAEGLYQAGEVDRAEALLERSLGIEPVPDSIDLLGTISLKRSELSRARQRYENLANMAYEDEAVRLQWEAKARLALGEIAGREGDAAGSILHIRMALRHINELLARPGTPPQARALRYVERGKLLFLLGDVDLAMDDFGRARELAPTSTQTYADPLQVVVSHGFLEEARSIFRPAMAQEGLSDDLKLYFSLWMKQLADRQGRPPDAEAQRFLTTYGGHPWGRLLARHALGQLPFEDLLGHAQSRGERAEAYFYEGLARWNAGDLAGGKSMMQEVLETEMMGFLEYDMARTYLDWNDVPRTARAPLSSTSSAHQAAEIDSGSKTRPRAGGE